MAFETTTWTHEAFGSVKFCTNPENQDAYTDRVRTDWTPDRETLLAIELLRARRGLAVDLGANIGTWCLPVALGTGVRIIAVEALPKNANALAAARTANKLEHAVTIVQCGVADHAGVMRLTGDSAYGTADDDGDIEVSTRAVDDILGPDSTSASLLKIDIEGCEMLALRGAKRTLSTRPSVIIEGNGAHCYSRGHLPQDFTAIFESLGMQVYMIAGPRLVPVTSSSYQPFGLINYLATTHDVRSLEHFDVGPLSDAQVRSAVKRAMFEMKPGYGQFMHAQTERRGVVAPDSVSDMVAG